jgi:hypothetical protein
MRIIGQFEDRLDTVRLRADAVDGDDPCAVAERIDIVADLRIGGRKNRRAFAFDWKQLLLEMKRYGAFSPENSAQVGGSGIEL